jgi:hypothetical protein
VLWCCKAEARSDAGIVPARRKPFAIVQPLVPVFNYQFSAADIVAIQRMLASMEDAYRLIE